MATNFNQPADAMEFTAPSGGVTDGTPVLIGGLFVIPTVTAAAGARFNGQLDGAWTLPKATGEAWTEGAPAFWDVANARVSIDSTVGLQIGAIAAAALSADTTGIVRLNETSLSGGVLNIRKRFSVAQVNAGATLLPAIPGVKYRMISASAIAVGGAAGAVTTVDLKATQSTSVVKLVAFAQASLTQSAKLTDGGTGAAILPDGASYVANDVNTAVTVGITGASITTATSIDFIVSYALE